MSNSNNMQNLETAIHSALVTQFRVDRKLLNAQTKLFSSGLIDSLSVMDLVGVVESALGQVIPPADITLENFDSIERIIAYSRREHGSGEVT